MPADTFAKWLGPLRRFLAGGGRTGAPASDLPSGLSERVGDEEPLARFLTSKSQYSTDKRAVKYAAFLPSRNHGNTSVFRHSGSPASELWAIGDNALREGVAIRGAGIVQARIVRENGLEATASEPPPRHANIEHWPTTDDPEMTKASRIETARALAAGATLLLRDA